MRYPGFVGPSARSRSRIACDDRTVNLFIEKNDSGTGKAPYTLYRTPGYQTWCDLGVSNPVRGLFTLNGGSFAVAGTKLFELPTTLGGSATLRATGIDNPDDGPVSMAGNGDGGFQIVIAAGGSLYNFDTRTSALTLIPDIEAVQVVFMDGTFFALALTSSIYASATEDGSSWNPADVFQRETVADRMIAMIRVGTELWTFGSQASTPLYDAGAADFPLAPNPTVCIQRGITAPWSLAIADGAPIWLGQGIEGGGTVYRASGYTPQPISTDAVEYAISQYATVADAEAIVYQEEGNLFYILNFPSANATWAYDLSEGLWHERGEWNGLDYDHLPIRGSIFAQNVNLVGSRTTGKVYQQSLSLATQTDGVTGIRWLRRAPHLCQEKVRQTYTRLEIDAEVGVGLASAVTSSADPHVGLRWSNDGGQSFGNMHYASLGRVGAYGTRVFWNILGQARDRVFEVSGAAPVVTALIDAYLDVRSGTS